MNSNEFIQKNWMSALLLIVVVVFLYLSFGRRDRVETSDNRSFIGSEHGDPATSLSPGYDAGSQIAPAPGVIQQPQTGARTEPIQWCVFLDGANYIPDLFGEGIDNGGGGTNWHSAGGDDPKDPQGVFTENGKTFFFVKKSYLDKNGSSPMSAQLKSNITGWNNPLTMSWDNIAGEQALVYVK